MLQPVRFQLCLAARAGDRGGYAASYAAVLGCAPRLRARPVADLAVIGREQIADSPGRSQPRPPTCSGCALCVTTSLRSEGGRGKRARRPSVKSPDHPSFIKGDEYEGNEDRLLATAEKLIADSHYSIGSKALCAALKKQGFEKVDNKRAKELILGVPYPRTHPAQFRLPTANCRLPAAHCCSKHSFLLTPAPRSPSSPLALALALALALRPKP